MNITIRIRNIDADRRKALLDLLVDIGIDFAVTES